MAFREDLTKFIKVREGFSAKAYKCPSGYSTIGYGHNLETNSITKTAANQILADDLKKVYSLMKDKDLSYLAELPENWQFVCTDMLFNLGKTKFLGMRRLNAALFNKHYDWALAELVDSAWFFQVGDRSKLLWLIADRDIDYGMGLLNLDSKSIKAEFYNYYADWYERVVDEGGFAVASRVRKLYEVAVDYLE